MLPQFGSHSLAAFVAPRPEETESTSASGRLEGAMIATLLVSGARPISTTLRDKLRQAADCVYRPQALAE